jgi:PhnB protein
MRYMIIVKGDERVEGGEMPRAEDIAAMAEFHEELAGAGALVAADGLKPTVRGFRVRYNGTERQVIDGPFSETRELIGGFTMIRVDSREEAEAWARRFPNPAGEGKPCEIEVREVFELDDFEPSEGVERFRELERHQADAAVSLSAPVPHLVVSDGRAAIDFYARAFGAVLADKHLAEDGKRYMHAALRLGNGRLFLHDEFPEFGGCGGAQSPRELGAASCTFHLDVADADAAWQQAVEAGAEVVMALEDQFWGMRYGQLRDPFGYLWAIGGPVSPP